MKSRRRGHEDNGYEFCDFSKLFTLFITVKTIAKLKPQHSDKFEIKLNQPTWLMFSRQHKIWSFHVFVLQRTAKKCTKNHNARAQPLYRSFVLKGSRCRCRRSCVNSLLNQKRHKVILETFSGSHCLRVLLTFLLLFTAQKENMPHNFH